MKPIITFSSAIFLLLILQLPNSLARNAHKKSGKIEKTRTAKNQVDEKPEIRNDENSTSTRQEVYIVQQSSQLPCSGPPGYVIVSFPEKCMQFVCNQGYVEPLFFYGKETCHCCEFDGKLYKNGDTLPGVCARLVCMNGKWNATGHVHECCKQCRVYDDPHIKTFDSPDTQINWYDWHSPCNYSLAQEFHEFMDTYDPSFGVFGNFKYCWGVACVDQFDYKDNHMTNIRIKVPHGNTIEINGHPYDVKQYPAFVKDNYGYTHPVLAWRHNAYCIRIVGTQKMMLQICNRDIRIFAHEALSGQIGGLCGYFNHYDQDDFTDREMQQYPLKYYPQKPSFWFPTSWQTDMDYGCLNTKFDPNIVSSNFKDSYTWNYDWPECDDIKMEMYEEQCYHYLVQVIYNSMGPTDMQLKLAAKSCAYDLCAVNTNGVRDDVHLWLEQAARMLSDTIDIDSNTIREDEVLPEYMITDPNCNN